MTLAEAIKAFRAEAGLTLKEFGRLVGINESRVCQLEQGGAGVSRRTRASLEKIGFILSKTTAEWAFVLPAKFSETVKNRQQLEKVKPVFKRHSRERLSKLPSNRRRKRQAQHEHEHERSGDLLCLPQRKREQFERLIQPVTADKDVVKLSKHRRMKLDAQNVARMLAGHNQVLVKVYSCLNCRTRFESVGDRMCDSCKNDKLPVLSGLECI